MQCALASELTIASRQTLVAGPLRPSVGHSRAFAPYPNPVVRSSGRSALSDDVRRVECQLWAGKRTGCFRVGQRRQPTLRDCAAVFGNDGIPSSAASSLNAERPWPDAYHAPPPIRQRLTSKPAGAHAWSLPTVRHRSPRPSPTHEPFRQVSLDRTALKRQTRLANCVPPYQRCEQRTQRYPKGQTQ
jgi:hypothetical protein